MTFDIKTLAEYEIVRKIGVCNMLDVKCVYEAAKFYGLKRLQKIIEEKKYTKLILTYSEYVSDPILKSTVEAETELLKKKVCERILKYFDLVEKTEESFIRDYLLTQLNKYASEEILSWVCHE